VFIELGVRAHFNIPKIHQLSHYVQSIRLYGSPDGFNTELPERLHIDFAKDAYHSNNKRDYEIWLQHQEAIFLRIAYLEWLRNRGVSLTHGADCTDSLLVHDSKSSASESIDDKPMPVRRSLLSLQTHALAKSPAYPQQTVERLERVHGAVDFLPALSAFLKKYLPRNEVIPGHQDRFDIFKEVVVNAPIVSQIGETLRRRRIRATPAVAAPASGRKPGRAAHFDMVLVLERPDERKGGS
ncbi:hypothetical protein PAXRUDRAFT_154070, partial [Paxillus rubicundulus Ve08.2h10]